MLTLRELVRLSDEQLDKLDIALKNLICAMGLPGSEKIDVDFCLARLDKAASLIGPYIQRNAHCFEEDRATYDNSWAVFRAVKMTLALKSDFGLRYNPAKINLESLTAEDVFIHGIFQGEGGICTSIPVVIVAVGRRLGYPLKLVTARAKSGQGHVFARWEGEGERFNIEASSERMDCVSDDHYRSGLYELTPELEEAGCYLKSSTSREELSGFLHERAVLLSGLHRHRQAIESWAWACSLAPRNRMMHGTLAYGLSRWREALIKEQPPNFPTLSIAFPPRRFPDLDEALEREIIHLETRAAVLGTPTYDIDWFIPMKRFPQRRPNGYPERIVVTYPPDPKMPAVAIANGRSTVLIPGY